MILTNYRVIKFAGKMFQGLPRYTARKQVFIIVISSIAFDNAFDDLIVKTSKYLINY